MTFQGTLPFIHPSFAHEHGLSRDNQRLEFLGDAILSFLIAEHLYTTFPDRDEGFLSKSKAHLVSTTHLAQKARTLKLNEHLMLGVGEERSGGRGKEKLLADTFEAYIAFNYLQEGLEKCRNLIHSLFDEEINLEYLESLMAKNHKTRLQEDVQKDGSPPPVYRVIEQTGKPHSPIFVVEVRVGDRIVGRGEGTSKKEAEQAAALAALNNMEERDDEEKDR